MIFCDNAFSPGRAFRGEALAKTGLPAEMSSSVSAELRLIIFLPHALCPVPFLILNFPTSSLTQCAMRFTLRRMRYLSRHSLQAKADALYLNRSDSFYFNLTSEYLIIIMTIIIYNEVDHGRFTNNFTCDKSQKRTP